MKRCVLKCSAVFMVAIVLLTVAPFNNVFVESLKTSSVTILNKAGKLFDNISIALPTLSLEASAYMGSSVDKDGRVTTWNVAEKTLTLSGDGKFPEYHANNRPGWEPYKEQIEKVIVKGSLENVPQYACYNYPNLKTVIINGVTTIGQAAFSGCTSLETVSIAKAEKIYSAFSGCTALEEVKLPDGLKYMTGTFNGCTNLKSVNIPETVTYIGAGTFKNCSSLQSLELPSALEKIGVSAFSKAKCFDGKELVLPDTVTVIGEGAFADCNITKLTTPVIGEGLETKKEETEGFIGFMFGKEQFEESTCVTYSKEKYYIPYSLKEITVTKQLNEYNFYNVDCIEKINVKETVENTYVPKNCFKNCDGLNEVVFENSSYTEGVGAIAFQNCTKLKSVTLSQNIKWIGESAFDGCSSLENVVFPDGDFYVRRFAFRGTRLLSDYEGDFLVVGDGVLINYKGEKTEVALPSTVKRIACPFDERADVTSVKLNDGLKFISIDAFYGCQNIRELIVPGGVEAIAEGAFRGMCGLKSLTLPFVGTSSDSKGGYLLSLFGSGTCSVCKGTKCSYTEKKYNGRYYYVCKPKSFKNLTVTGGELASECLRFMGITNLTLGNVKSISTFAFHNTGIEKLNFTNEFSLSEIPDYAFTNNLITEITIPKSVKILNNAFSGNPITKIEFSEGLEIINGAFSGIKITKLALPDSVKEIGEYTFSNCEELKTVTISKNVEKISPAAFYRSDVEKYILSKENPYFFSEYGIIYTAKGELVLYPMGSDETVYRISDKVTSIDDGILSSLDFIEAFVVDKNNVTFTSVDGVLYNKALTELIRYPKAKTNCDYQAPATLREVRSFAFSDVTGLGTVEFKNDVKLNAGCFSSAEFNKLIVVNLDQRLDHYFDKINDTTSRTFLKELVLTNQSSDLASGFASRYKLQSFELNGTLKKVGDYAFKLSDIKKLALPDSVIEIGESAFNQCIKLENVKLSNSLKIIGDEAFYACPVKNVEFPQMLTAIGAWSFAFTELQYVELPDTVTSVGRCAFSGSNVKKTVISENLVDISAEAFQNCRDLEIVVLGSKVKNIEAQAFQNCDSLDMIVIPSSVISIDDSAFVNTSENLVIYCNEDSYAVQYATSKNIKYTTLKLSEIPNQIYTGVAIEPEVAASVNGNRLELNSQYTLSYSDNINVGLAKVTARGIGDFKNLVAKAQFQISERQLTDATITYMDVAYYEPNGAEPKVSVYIGGNKLEKGKDYELMNWDGVKNVGTYNVTVKGINNLSGTYNFIVDVLPRSITVAKVSKAGDITVTDSGYTLTEGVDYTVEKRTDEEGNEKIYVCGIGNYTDEKEVKENSFSSFNIFEAIINSLKKLLYAIFNIFK